MSGWGNLEVQFFTLLADAKFFFVGGLIAAALPCALRVARCGMYV